MKNGRQFVKLTQTDMSMYEPNMPGTFLTRETISLLFI